MLQSICDLCFPAFASNFFCSALGGFSRGLYVEKWAPFVKVNDDKNPSAVVTYLALEFIVIYI